MPKAPLLVGVLADTSNNSDPPKIGSLRKRLDGSKRYAAASLTMFITLAWSMDVRPDRPVAADATAWSAPLRAVAASRVPLNPIDSQDLRAELAKAPSAFSAAVSRVSGAAHDYRPASMAAT